MIFALLTLLTALALATVSGWFSIIGIMSIYAGAAYHAFIMGVVLEAGKLVTTSWLYRNWKFSTWKLKIPLVIFTIILMLITSIGVFGFLSKSHLEQGASTIDNSAKVERFDQQIAREKSIIADDEKLISQFDETINSYIGKDRTDKSVAVRRSQNPQRKKLRDDIDASQKKIDEYSDQKLALQSEVRKLQLDTGPIRYIAELIYGVDNNVDKNIEAAVRMFTLIIDSTLDPLAVILLIAANHTLLRIQNEKIQKTEEEKCNSSGTGDVTSTEENNQQVSGEEESSVPLQKRPSTTIDKSQCETLEETEIYGTVLQETTELLNEIKETNTNEDTSVYTSEHIQPDISILLETQTGGSEVPDVQGESATTRLPPQEMALSPDALNETKEIIQEEVRSLHHTEHEFLGSMDSEETTITLERDISWSDTAALVTPQEMAQVIKGLDEIKNTTPEKNEEISTADIGIASSGNTGDQISLPVADKIAIVPDLDKKEEIQKILVQPKMQKPWAAQDSSLRELTGTYTHFIPQRVNEEEKHKVVEEAVAEPGKNIEASNLSSQTIITEEIHSGGSEENAQDLESAWQIRDRNKLADNSQTHKYPKSLSWLTEFKRI